MHPPCGSGREVSAGNKDCTDWAREIGVLIMILPVLIVNPERLSKAEFKGNRLVCLAKTI